MGRLDEALARLREGTELWSLVSPVSSHFDAVGLAYVLQLQGALDESDMWRERTESSAAASVGALELFLLEIRGHRALRDGRMRDASQAYLDLEALVDRMGMREPCFPPWGRHAVAAHVGAGREVDARRVVDWLDARGSGLPCRFPRIAAATGRALIAEHRGDRDAAAAAHRTALALHEGVELPVENIETLLEYGSFLRRAGQPAAARPVLAEAAALAEDTGAGWLADLAVEELRVAGGRRRRRRDPEALTPQEHRVAGLAAQGRTNKDIASLLHVSEATIETHLRHIYAKLGVGSRRALMLRTKDPGFPRR
jgi:DNA-binding CsgD family transcriptional regulator